MKAKSVVKWGFAALAVLSGLTLWMVYQTEKISKHEYKWQRNQETRRFAQEVPHK